MTKDSIYWPAGLQKEGIKVLSWLMSYIYNIYHEIGSPDILIPFFTLSQMHCIFYLSLAQFTVLRNGTILHLLHRCHKDQLSNASERFQDPLKILYLTKCIALLQQLNTRLP